MEVRANLFVFSCTIGIAADSFYNLKLPNISYYKKLKIGCCNSLKHEFFEVCIFCNGPMQKKHSM